MTIAQQTRAIDVTEGATGPHLTPFSFLIANGRYPHLSDPIKPYRYKAWLTPYIQGWSGQIAAENGVVDRWTWHLTNLLNERVDGPIPQLTFAEPFSGAKAALKAHTTLIDLIERQSGSWSALHDYLRWFAWATGVIREPQHNFTDELETALYKACNVTEMLRTPADCFGYLLSEYKGSGKRNPTAFYPTPTNVVQMMTLMTFGSEPQPEHLMQSVCDPCVGTGRMLLLASNYSVRLYGTDIDLSCVLATKINGALFAPWLSFPYPESFFKDADPPPAPPANITQERALGGWAQSGQGLLFGEPE